MSRNEPRNNKVIDLTNVDPAAIMSSRPPKASIQDKLDRADSENSERQSLISSGVSSTTARRELSAAEKLNRDFLFGGSVHTLHDDDLANADEEWSMISSKNAEKRTSHATGIIDTLVHLIRGNVGPGLLSLAYAVSNAGYVFGPVAVLIMGIIAVHNMGILLDSARTLCKWNGIQALDYGETMLFAVRERGGSKRLASTAKIIVNTFLILTQLGFCSVYFVFLGETLQQVMSVAFCLNWDHRIWSAILILPISLFAQIRNLDNLAPLSVVANVGIFYGIFVIFCDEIYKLTSSHQSDQAAILKEESELYSFTSFMKTCLFFGNAIYAFEGIGVVLPLENKMKNPSNAKRVVYGGMSFTVSLFVCFSLVGYLVYGPKIQGSVHLNLCGTSEFTTIVFMTAKLGIGIAVFVSYMVMFYVPMDFLQPYVYKKLRLDVLTYKYPRNHTLIQTGIQTLFRISVILLTATLAIAIPDLDDLITLVGAFASSGLALIFPPVIETLTFWNDPERKFLGIFRRPFWFAKDVVVMCFGILGFMLGTFAALYNILLNYEGKKQPVEPCEGLFFACPFYKN